MRKPVHVATVFSISAFIGSAALAAQAPSAAPTLTSGSAAHAVGTPMKAFSRLFAPTGPDERPMLRLKVPAPNLAPLRICGIKVLHPDPRIDPKFEVPLRDTATQFTMRTIPSLCR